MSEGKAVLPLRMLRALWAFRSFIIGSVKREFQSRYRGSQFGAFWIVAQPLAMIYIYTVVFAELMKPSMQGHKSPFAYGIYLCAGILPWNLFAQMLARSVNIFVDQASLLKKVSFPKLTLPAIVIISSWLDFAIVLSILLVFLVVTGEFPGWVLLSGIPVLLIQIAFTIGLGIFLATINVFYRDINQTVSVVLQFWFWLTPIVYLPNSIPGLAQEILKWNPVWPLIRAYQGIVLNKTMPHWADLIYPSLLAALLVWLGMFAFHRLQGEIVDEL